MDGQTLSYIVYWCLLFHKTMTIHKKKFNGYAWIDLKFSLADTKFKQQKLPSWQPILTAGTVLPAFFAIGIAFIPLGVALYITSEGVSIHIISHTLSVFHHWLNFHNIFITTVVKILINLINNLNKKKLNVLIIGETDSFSATMASGL